MSLTSLLLLFAASDARAAQDAATFDLERTRAVLTAEIERTLASGVASISIALVRGDEIVWSAAFGYANVWAESEARPETLYCTGSTFKAVTATAILQLVEAGKLALDDPVNQHLGENRVQDLPEHPVTVRHILSHASGLTAGANMVPLWQRRLPQALDALPATLSAQRPPEESYEYNNYAYGLAGYLIERVSGEGYEDYIVEHVLRPLGVRTRHPFSPSPSMVERMALPYSAGAFGGKRPAAVGQVRFDVYPAGDAWLTAEEMARFLAAHLNEGEFGGKRILSAESVREAHRPQFLDYGLGWAVSATNPQRIAHAGGVPGFATYMVGDLEHRVGAYVMSNSGDMSAIGNAAIALLAGEEWVSPADRVALAREPSELEPYVGRYQVQPALVLTITLEDGHLMGQATGQPQLELFAEEGDVFFLREVDARLRFLRDEKGRVDRLVLDQGGMSLTGKRVE